MLRQIRLRSHQGSLRQSGRQSGNALRQLLAEYSGARQARGTLCPQLGWIGPQQCLRIVSTSQHRHLRHTQQAAVWATDRLVAAMLAGPLL